MPPTNLSSRSGVMLVMGTGTEDYTAYVEESWTRLFRTAYALTGDVTAADDLMQATLVKVFVSWRKVRKADSVDAYVRRVMVNHAASTWRSRTRRPEVLTAEPRAEATRDTVHHPEGEDELWALIHELPARQRAVLVLRYYEDLSEQEIAHALDIAPGTVKSQASAAIAKLRDRLMPVQIERGQA